MSLFSHRRQIRDEIETRSCCGDQVIGGDKKHIQIGKLFWYLVVGK